MKRYLLVVIAVAFILGIFLDNLLALQSRVIFVYIMPVIFLFAFFSYRFPILRSVACIALVTLAGMTYHHCRYNSFPSNSIINYAESEKTLIKIEGKIIQPPLKKVYSNTYPFNSYQGREKRRESAVFFLKANKILTASEEHKVCGNLKVSVYNTEKSDKKLRYGDEVEIVGKMFLPSRQTNPGQFDYRKYLLQSSIRAQAILSVKGMRNIKVKAGDKGNRILKFVYSLKDELRRTIYTLTPENDAPVIASLLLGERSNVPYHTLESFINTGTIHFLAISGLHIGILVVSLHWFLALAGLNRKAIAFIIIAFVIIYAIMTGLKPPVLRAGFMALIYYGSIIIDRRWHTPSGISAAAILMLLINPAELFSVSFQLSFLALIGIIYLSEKIETLLQRKPRLQEQLMSGLRWDAQRALNAYWRKTAAVSAAAWLGVMPLVAHYFHIAAPIAIPLNIIIFPLVWFILVSGFVFLIIGSLSLTLAAPFAWAASLCDAIMAKIISFFAIDHVSFFYVNGPSTIWIVVYYAATIFALCHKKAKLKSSTAIGVIVIIIGGYVCADLFTSKKERIQLTCLDVGHGSAVIIQFPDNKTLLLDIGTWSNFDVGKNIAAPFLWKSKIKTIGAAVISHRDRDHWNGLPALLKRFNVKTVPVNQRFHNSETGKKLFNIAENEGATIKIIGNGDEIAGFNGAKITVLNPPKNREFISGMSTNNTSCVIKIEAFGRSILYCADIEEDGINMIVSKYGNSLRSDIIIVPHHGAYSANINALIDHVNPEYAIISSKSTDISHDTIVALENNNIKVFKTCEQGAITAIIDINGIRVSGFINK